jgi:ribosomal protein L31
LRAVFDAVFDAVLADDAELAPGPGWWAGRPDGLAPGSAIPRTRRTAPEPGHPRGDNREAGIHPEYRPVVFRDRAAGYACLIRSTVRTTATIEREDGATYPLVGVDISQASRSAPK